MLFTPYLVTETNDDAGTRLSDLMNWYLTEVQEDIESETELIRRKTLAERVIQRLVTHVSILGGLDT